MINEEEINDAANRLREGKLVAFPTETVYGLGANALDPIAVSKIFELKGRPRFDPLIVHISKPEDIGALVTQVPSLAHELMQKFWPGPLSLVLSKSLTVPDIVTAGLPSVAVRCPSHPIARKFLNAAKVPVSAPSANRFGMVSPTTAQHVFDQFGDAIACLDGGPCDVGVESTVISFVDSTDSRPRLLRHGGITLEQIESVTGPIETMIHKESQPTSPGQLSRHYSPRTPLVIASEDVTPESLTQGHEKVGLLCLSPVKNSARFTAVEILSHDGSLREAATRLFAAMRNLDSMSLDLIVAQAVPEVDLGRAIMDRLTRAAAK